MMPSPFKEAVLLVEEAPLRLRVVILTQPGVVQILERVHVSPTAETVRTWVHQHGERDDTGHARLFREVPLTPGPREVSEAPLFDELTIKTPVPFFPPKAPTS